MSLIIGIAFGSVSPEAHKYCFWISLSRITDIVSGIVYLESHIVSVSDCLESLTMFLDQPAQNYRDLVSGSASLEPHRHWFWIVSFEARFFTDLL